MMVCYVEQIADCLAGNMCGLVGINRFLFKSQLHDAQARQEWRAGDVRARLHCFRKHIRPTLMAWVQETDPRAAGHRQARGGTAGGVQVGVQVYDCIVVLCYRGAIFL